MTFEYLREEILNRNCTPTQLNKLKEKYRDLINSTRTYNKIQTLQDLIFVLEKRYEIHENDVLVLDDIKKYLSDKNLQSPRTNINGTYNPTSHHNNRTSTIPYNTQSRIYKLLCQKLSGDKLKSFARSDAIQLQEGLIDSLDEYPIDEQIRIILQEGEATDPKTWIRRLIAGLHQARRKDLALEVNNILH